MDPLKFTTIAHATHRHCNPLDPVVLAAALGGAVPGAGARALDVGCGKGALLVELAERHGVRGTGVDINHAFLDEARALAAERGVTEAVTFVEGEAARLDLGSASVDLGACIGSTHALGGYPDTLRALARLVRPGGRVLVGQGFWRHPPAPEYLERLGAAPDEMTTHEGNVAAGIAAGLAPEGAWASTDEDWDRYEDRYAANVERYVAGHPGDPDAPVMLARIRRWRETYLRWGRDTLGFGLYRFRRP